MRYPIVATILACVSGATFSGVACAQSMDGPAPREIGATAMPAGRYYILEETTGKFYVLLVTDKGSMILGPPPQGVDVRLTRAGATPAATTASVSAPPPTVVAVPPPIAAPVPVAQPAPVAAAQPVAAPQQAAAQKSSGLSLPPGASTLGNAGMKMLMQKGMPLLMKQGAGKSLGDLLK